eukprot:66439-Pyramimonas_sp.AAC.1
MARTVTPKIQHQEGKKQGVDIYTYAHTCITRTLRSPDGSHRTDLEGRSRVLYKGLGSTPYIVVMPPESLLT